MSETLCEFSIYDSIVKTLVWSIIVFDCTHTHSFTCFCDHLALLLMSFLCSTFASSSSSSLGDTDTQKFFFTKLAKLNNGCRFQVFICQVVVVVGFSFTWGKKEEFTCCPFCLIALCCTVSQSIYSTWLESVLDFPFCYVTFPAFCSLRLNEGTLLYRTVCQLLLLLLLLYLGHKSSSFRESINVCVCFLPLGSWLVCNTERFQFLLVANI